MSKEYEKAWMDLARYLEVNNIAVNEDADYAAKRILEYFDYRAPAKASGQPDDCTEIDRLFCGAYNEAVSERHYPDAPIEVMADAFSVLLRKYRATKRESVAVAELAAAIRKADNGLDGDPLAQLLDETPKIDLASTTRNEADELIEKVCNAVAASLLKKYRITQIEDQKG